MQNKLPVLAIDARLYGNRSGAGRIATATVDRFVTDHAASFSNIVLIAHSRSVYDALPTGGNVTKVFVRGHFLLGKLFLVPFVLKARSVDVYFSPTSELPLWKFGKTKYVNMVHDLFMEEILDREASKERGLLLAIKYFFKTRDALWCFYLAGLFRASFFRADSILAISDFSRRTLCERYGIPMEKCRTLSIGADELFFQDYDKKQASDFVRSRFGIGGRYVFTYDAMSDFGGFSKQFEEVCTRFGFKWVILSRYAVVYDAFVSSGAGSNTIFIKEFVSDEELVNLIRGSEFVFFPSGGEGFGIPIAECLACGRTLLVPGITAMPEVGGPHVTCYDPNDLNDLTKKAQDICGQYRDFKITKDDPYLLRYSWPSFVNSLVTLLHAELN